MSKKQEENAKHERESYVRLMGCAGERRRSHCNRKYLLGHTNISEEPIFAFPYNEQASEQLQMFICQQIDALGEHQRRAFLSKHDIHAYRNAAVQNLGIIRINGLPIETTRMKGGDLLRSMSHQLRLR